MNKIRVYIAGKVSKDSVFGTHDWRDGFCQELSRKSDLEILNLDPTKTQEPFKLDQNDGQLIYGRNAYMIKSADIVIVNLTDDISVGGSQEMLIAKYYAKPLIGIARRGGKFNKESKEYYGEIFKNYLDPYVSIPCDFVAETEEQAAQYLKKFSLGRNELKIKGIEVIDEALEYYLKNSFEKDKYLRDKSRFDSPS